MKNFIKNFKIKNYSKYFYIFIQFLVPILFGFYSIKLGQDINWDTQNYHLYNPYAFLNNRLNFDLAPAGLQTYFNPLVDMLYFFVMKNYPPKFFGFMFGMLHGLNFVLLFNICACCLKTLDLKNKKLALILASLGILSVGFLSEVGTTLGDNLVSLFILSSLLIIIRSINLILANKIKYAKFLVALAGFIAGLGAGLNLKIAIYVVALCFSFLFISISWTKKILFIAVFGLGVGSGFLVAGGAWYYNVWHQFGNPIFPTYNDVFKGELAQNLPIKDERFLPKNTFEKIFYPAIFTANPLRVAELRYEQISWVFLYVSLILFFVNRFLFFLKRIGSKPLTPEIKFILLFFCISYLLWLNLFGIYRYAITIEILIPLILFIIFIFMFQEKWIRMGTITVLIFITVFNLHALVDWGHSAWAKQAFHTSYDTKILKNNPVGSVILIGQPLAWIIPILNINVPFIQIMPNISVSKAYWQKANSIIASHGKKKLIIFDSNNVTEKDIDLSLKNINLTLDTNNCQDSEFYLGAQKYIYKFCINGN